MNKLVVLMFGMLCCSCSFTGKAEEQPANTWTILYYAAGSNSSEVDLMADVEEMIKGKMATGYELLLLIDRIEGHSNDSAALGENFTDTRLYRIDQQKYERLNGRDVLPEITMEKEYEGNMGDAHLLKRFIQYGKKYYPAKHYMLVMRSHGNGVGMCADRENGGGDKLYPAELSDVLTEEESVDILGLDVCSMAGLENYYEWRPRKNGFSANYILASAPLSAAWAYDELLGRLQMESATSLKADSAYFEPGQEQTLNPITMTPNQFAHLLIEEIYDSQPWASWALVDNSKISAVKQQADVLAKLLIHEEKAVVEEAIVNSLGYHHNTSSNLEIAELTFPYRDAFGFFRQLSVQERLKQPTRIAAKLLCEKLDELVIYSYYGRGYFPENQLFEEGKSGVYMVLPQGSRTYSASGRSFWSHTTWFHPNSQQERRDAYGKYDWCSDGAIPANNEVDNFFEYLDFLFDTTNTAEGGVNNYQW